MLHQRGLEEQLGPQPKHVGRILEAATPKMDGVAEVSVKPKHGDLEVFVEIPVHTEFGCVDGIGPNGDLEVFVEIPVHTEFGCVDGIGPKGGVSEATLKHLIP